MIIGSLGVLVASAILLITGVVIGNDQLLTASIVASIVSALFLYVGAASIQREQPYRRPYYSQDPDETAEFSRIIPDTPTNEIPAVRQERFESTEYRIDRGDPNIPAQASQQDEPSDSIKEELDGEPSEQKLSHVEKAQLMRLTAEVVVIDGRPRFHHSGCVHLVGRETESLPVAEAMTLGFGPCALCEPTSWLVRDRSTFVGSG
ncbi:hypothetical protein [Haloglycomyces albus]|uniref:hypothetical protein n=1 Tax=Haloglycomyces albus TaxID=526067 RepID=UPI00046CBBCD|nr:hypothetical protein [Haloglycomyces albus]